MSQVRAQLWRCQTLFVSATSQDDSVGVPFSANDPEDLRRELKLWTAQHGKNSLNGGAFYVLGVGLNREAEVQKAFTQMLEEEGFSASEISVQVLPVPSRFIETQSVSIFRDVAERVRYFFPSIKLDYQQPRMGEVTSGISSSLALEIPNIIFLYSALPMIDAHLTVASHAAVLGAYNVYAKSMLNWLLRSSYKDEKIARVELFLKQMMLSLPFVVNYSVFGNFSTITKFYSDHGWNATLAAFPEEMANFATTQGVTLFLQTLFYSVVITRGFGGWVQSQEQEQSSAAARDLRPWLQTPVLALNAILVAMAASQWGDPLFETSYFQLNLGHMGLLGLTLAGGGFFKYFPKTLNRVFPISEKFKHRFVQVKTRFFKQKISSPGR